METPRSIKEIDLRPIPGKKYWSSEREWREELIYFLMVDRFHDDRDRRSVGGVAPARGSGDAARLRRFCGGTLAGITRHIDYIQDLGCTAIWLSPIFENDGAPDRASGSYHGYAIRNYLKVDPRFGTKEDLVELVAAAHQRTMRVFLDAVANHCGDVWFYPDDQPYFYSDDGRQYEIGGWRHDDYPVPVELRNPDYFHRRGQIRDWGWDAQPETQMGDFFGLKGFNNDDNPAGLALQQIIIDVHRYWIREADIDGYRMDAVKHMGEMAIARFCQEVREYAYQLGKRDFFLFGELIAGDDAVNRYTGPNTAGRLGDRTIYYGLNSVLDFPLYWILPGVIKGYASPATLTSRYDALRERALSRGELGRYFVTFLDNHDQVGQHYKRRFGAGAHPKQVVAAVGYLICALGTPCIYYGTEQGFAGEGTSEEAIREAMFDLDDTERNLLNKECEIYREISAIAAVNRSHPALRFGRMYFREVSGDGSGFGMPSGQPCTLAFSRILAGEEVLVAYNTSTDQARSDCVAVDSALHPPGSTMAFLYGAVGEAAVQAHPDQDNATVFVRLQLAPLQFVILGRLVDAG
ncbi:MAG: alpha-amylase [Acidobacteria bacterium]|nr:alpha-amylase [Acidobacteriota bacterium]